MERTTNDKRRAWVAAQTKALYKALQGATFVLWVVGGADFSDKKLFADKLGLLLAGKDGETIAVVTSGTSGAELYAELWAKKNGHLFARLAPDWDQFGRSAGYVRSEVMSNVADGLVAFYDGADRGTSTVINYAMRVEIPTRIVRY